MRKIRKALREIEELKAAHHAGVVLEKNQHEKIAREVALREELAGMEHAIDIKNARVCTCCGPDIKGLNNLTLEAPSREQSFVRRLSLGRVGGQSDVEFVYPDPIKEKLEGRFRPRRAVRGALSPEEQDAWHAMFGGTTRPTSPVLEDGGSARSG